MNEARRLRTAIQAALAGALVATGACTYAQDLGTLPSDDLPVPVDAVREGDDPADEPTSAPDAGEQAQAAATDAPGRYRLEVIAPPALRTLLLRHLDLSRFRQEPDITEFEIARLAAAAPAQVLSLLQTQGHFAPETTVRRVPAQGTEPPGVIVEVEPGPQARIDRVTLEIQGAFQEALAREDRRTGIRWRILRARWSLRPGDVFTQAAWDGAKNDLLAALRAEGYPAAGFAGTTAQVDPQAHAVRLVVIVDSGPLYRLGDVQVEGIGYTTSDAVRNLVPFERGTVFSEAHLLDYQDRLQRLALYQGVAVELDASPETADAAPVLVRVRENPLQTATVSLGYSTNTGQRAGVAYTHRNPLGTNWLATGRVQLGRDERLAAIDLKSYPKARGLRYLLAASTDHLEAAGAVTASQRMRWGWMRETERIDRLVYAEFHRTTVRTESLRTSARAVSGNWEWIRRDVNSRTFPTRGWVLDARIGAGLSQDSDGDTGPFTRAYLRSTWYHPLGNRSGWLLQARGEVGQVIKRSSLGVPDALLFRAGGDDSVRGYGYQTLGPTREGATIGGPVLLTGSIELMRRISPQWRDWYGAAFFDIGNAAQRWSDWTAERGVGVGVRWRSPVGALRADLAYGLGPRKLRLHLSVGAAF